MRDGTIDADLIYLNAALNWPMNYCVIGEPLLKSKPNVPRTRRVAELRAAERVLPGQEDDQEVGAVEGCKVPLTTVAYGSRCSMADHQSPVKRA